MIALAFLVIPPLIFAASALSVAAHTLMGHKGRTAAHVHFRLSTGDHLDGKPRNNRTAFTPGTKQLRGHADLPMTWLARQPRAKRAAAYWAAWYLLPVLGYGLAVAFTLTAALAAAVSAGLAAWGLLSAARWAARHRHRTRTVRPLSRALGAHLARDPAALRVKVRPRLETLQPGDEAVRVDALPDQLRALPGRERDTVQAIVNARMPPAVRLKYDWQTRRHPMRLVGVVAAAPPREVIASDFLDLIDLLGPNRYFLGVAAENREQIWERSTEDPHGMVTARSRVGKTNINLAVAATALRKGEHVTYIDPKRHSATCLAELDRYTLANDPGDVQAMWDAIAAFYDAMKQAIAGKGDGTPHTLIIDEVPQFGDLCRRHWAHSRGKGERLADMPPVRHLSSIVHEGAQFGFCALVDGQRLMQTDLFGYRQAFGLGALAGYTDAQWNYTIGTKPIPPVPGVKGRFWLAHPGHNPVLTQIVCADPRGLKHNERGWRQIALGGDPQPKASPWRAWTEPEHRRETIRLALPWTPRKELPALIQGSGMAAQYLGFRTTNAFVCARARCPIPGEFQATIEGVVTNCWARESLDQWQRTRPRRRTKATVNA